MTNVTDKENDPLLQEYAGFTFACAGCEAKQKTHYQGVEDLQQGLSIQCVTCEVQLKASNDDQAYMKQYSARQVSQGKGILIFCVLWFCTSFLILFIYGSQAAGLMTFAGVLISMGLKFSSSEDPQVFILEVANAE